MATKAWRLVDALEWGGRYLKEWGIEEFQLEARFFLQHILNRGAGYLYLNLEKSLSEESLFSFQNLVRRRKKRIPWQYLTGHTEFMGWDFLVNEEVLIPRPETEILVEAALKRLSTIGSKLWTVMDIGTGCGNIAIALAKSLPVQVYALDISEAALQVARMNAKRLAVKKAITFFSSDIFVLNESHRLSLNKESAAFVSKSILRNLEGKIDLVISNPPYIATNELDQLQPEVSHFEPRKALDGGESGLNFYPPLIREATILLRPGGYLALEMGISQAKTVKRFIVEKNQFYSPEISKDYSGIERVIMAQKR